MNFVQSVFILFLGISLTCASTSTNKKGSTVLDYLKDGFDAVYKYTEQSTMSHLKLKDFEGQTYDIHLRKTSQNDRNKFVMYYENVQLQGTHEEEPTEADLAALALPIIVSVQNEDLDLEYIYAREADTKKSLSWKHDALTLLLHNMTEQISELGGLVGIRSLAMEVEMEDMPFGNCTMDFSLKSKKGNIIIEMSAKRNKCTGDLDKDILESFGKYDATDIHGESEMKFGFIYDKITGQFLKSYLTMKGRAISVNNIGFSLRMALQFDSFKEIQQTFDETKNTKTYTEADIQ